MSLDKLNKKLRVFFKVICTNGLYRFVALTCCEPSPVRIWQCVLVCN